MADKNSVSSFFFNDESNPEDFYLNNDTPSNRKTDNLGTKKTTDAQDESVYSTVTASPTTRTVISNNFDWDNPNVDVPVAEVRPTLSSKVDFADKGDVLSNRDHTISDEEAIDEILKTEVVDLGSGQGRHDYFADLDPKFTTGFKDHDQSRNDDDRFVQNQDQQDREKNLAELDVFKQKLHDASESFSQISSSIEILSGDIDDANKDFSDYLATFDSAQEKVKPSVTKPIEEVEVVPSVTKSIEELAKIIEPLEPVSKREQGESDQPTGHSSEIDQSEQPPVHLEVEPIKQAPTLSPTSHASEPVEPPLGESTVPPVVPDATLVHETKPVNVQATEEINPTEPPVVPDATLVHETKPVNNVQPTEEINPIEPPVVPDATLVHETKPVNVQVTEEINPTEPPVIPTVPVGSVQPPVVETIESLVQPTEVNPLPVELERSKQVISEVEPTAAETLDEVVVENNVGKETTPMNHSGDRLREVTPPLSEAEAALQAKLAELEPESNSFDEMMKTEEIQKDDSLAQPVAEEVVENKRVAEEQNVSKSKSESLPDYSTILADLKQQAVMQVQNAVQSEMERLVNAKAKLEAELEALARNRNFENNITDLKERFSSIVSHRQETAPVTPTPSPVTSQKSPVVEIDESTSPITDVDAIEAQRTSIINATKKIMEKYDLSNEEVKKEVPEVDEPVVGIEKEEVAETVLPTTVQEAKFDNFVDEVDNIKKEIVKVIKNEIANVIKEEIADIKSSMHHDKVAEAAEQLKTRILVDAANEKKKLDELIQKTITHEIGLSLLDENNKAADSLDEMRNSLRHRQVGNEIEEQGRLYDMDRIRQELKDEILNEVRAWNSNLFSSSESKLQQEPPAEQVLGDWFDANNSAPTAQNEGSTTPSPSSRSANLVFDPEIANLKGRDLILKYVKDLTKKRSRKPK